MSKKPLVPLVGRDGNIFAILARATQALKQAGQPGKAEEMQARVFASGSYHEALGIVLEYVEEASLGSA